MVATNEPGTFCWIELATPDQGGATRFYSNVFGWEPSDAPLPDGGAYTTFSLGGRPVAAVATQQEPERAAGVPPHWNLYLQTDDVDAATDRAVAAGADLVAAPFDVLQHGRMAVLRDPAGTPFLLWQPGRHAGFAAHDEPGSFSWAELIVGDPDTAVAFYGELFGWTVDWTEMPSGPYGIMRLDGRSVAGVTRPPKEAPDLPPMWFLYLEVADATGTIAGAEANGGHLEHGPIPIPGVGTFAVLADPAHAVFGIIEPSS